MARRIFDTLWARLLLLLCLITVAGLSSGFLARELIIADFRKYMEGKLEDRSYLVIAKLEENFARNNGWVAELLVDDVIWALSTGLRVSIADPAGATIIDADRAYALLSPSIQGKLAALGMGPGHIDPSIQPSSYPLFRRGEFIGQLLVTCVDPHKEQLFIDRSNRLLLGALVVTTGISLLLGTYFARKIVRPMTRLNLAAQALRRGDEPGEIPSEGSVEFRELAGSFNKMVGALRKQEDLRRGLLADVAHELRTPVTVVRVQLEAMADGLVPPEPRTFRAAVAELDRLGGLLNGLDDLNRAEAGALSLKLDDFLLSPFLARHVESFSRLDEAGKVVFLLDCPQALSIHADPERLSQIVVNLLSNARKAISGKGTVHIIAVPVSKGVSLAVADSGMGIDPHELPHIYKRFYHRFADGLGLGLAIVKELVTAHGATISVESEVGRGTTVTMVFPAQSS